MNGTLWKSMRLWPVCLLLAVPTAQAQIFRCETPEGVVFSDRPCDDAAEIVELEGESQGVSGGPPEEVRDYLAERRTERAEAREAAREARAAPPPPQPVTIIQQPTTYPYAWPAFGYPRPPGWRPPGWRPPLKPEQPIAPPPPQRPPSDVLRPQR
jgi:hypothetical protein